MNRLSYLLSRWKGNIVIGLYTTSNDIELAANRIHKYSAIHRIKFVLYVRDDLPSIIPYYRGRSGKRKFNTIFPINFMRDLCIESITTTHYLYLDGDVFVSGTSLLSLLTRSSLSNSHQ